MQIIRRSSVTPSPWKNGGGVTHEFIRVPATDAVFRWRLSIAQIEVSGPFSDFAGYRRNLVLLRGAGVRLDVEGSPPRSLAEVGAMAEFDGALKTDCQLLNGPCTDLNLIVAHSVRSVAAWVELVGERRVVPAPPTSRDGNSCDGVLLIFGIVGGLSVESGAGPPQRLAPWDLAILPAGGSEVVAPDPGRGASSLVFFATLDDNSAPPPAG